MVLKVKCANCQTLRRPYGIRIWRKSPGKKYRGQCTSCGAVQIILLDYIAEFAPVDVREAHLEDGTVCEVVNVVKIKGKGGGMLEPLVEEEEPQVEGEEEESCQT